MGVEGRAWPAPGLKSVAAPSLQLALLSLPGLDAQLLACAEAGQALSRAIMASVPSLPSSHPHSAPLPPGAGAGVRGRVSPSLSAE